MNIWGLVCYITCGLMLHMVFRCSVYYYMTVNPTTGISKKKFNDFADEIERVLLKTNTNTHSMLGTYTMPYDTLLYFEYTREFSCAIAHVI